MPGDQELRRSISTVGQLVPVLYLRDRLIDGVRRVQICAELGLAPVTRQCRSVTDACSALWEFHPARAVELAKEHEPRASLTRVAEICGVRTADVARVVSKPKPAERRSPRRERSQKTELVRVWVEPQLLHYARQAAIKKRLTLSAFVRVAVWREVQDTLARAAREGSSRGPSPEWVMPREHRRQKPQ